VEASTTKLTVSHILSQNGFTKRMHVPILLFINYAQVQHNIKHTMHIQNTKMLKYTLQKAFQTDSLMYFLEHS